MYVISRRKNDMINNVNFNVALLLYLYLLTSRFLYQYGCSIFSPSFFFRKNFFLFSNWYVSMFEKLCIDATHDIMTRVFRLWAEVFHVNSSGSGTFKWQQVSEDLVPVNITCIQDSPECVYHITAYNSQVDKILDVRLVQPGES